MRRRNTDGDTWSRFYVRLEPARAKGQSICSCQFYSVLAIQTDDKFGPVLGFSKVEVYREAYLRGLINASFFNSFAPPLSCLNRTCPIHMVWLSCRGLGGVNDVAKGMRMWRKSILVWPKVPTRGREMHPAETFSFQVRMPMLDSRRSCHGPSPYHSFERSFLTLWFH